LIGAIVTSQLSTLYELQTVYGTEDAYDMLEIIGIDAYNKSLAMEKE
jgi:hypothetical protein